MAEIQGGRWDNFLRRVFSLKDPVVAPSVGFEIVPTIDANPDSPELELLRKWQLCTAYHAVAAVAGQNGVIQLFNPANSNTFVVVEKVQVWSAASNTFRIRWDATTQGAVSLSTHRDTRLDMSGGLGQMTVAEIRSGTAVGVAGNLTLEELREAGNVNLQVHTSLPFVLGPGNGYDIWGVNANLLFAASFSWRERAIEPTEDIGVA